MVVLAPSHELRVAIIAVVSPPSDPPSLAAADDLLLFSDLLYMLRSYTRLE